MAQEYTLQELDQAYESAKAAQNLPAMQEIDALRRSTRQQIAQQQAAALEQKRASRTLPQKLARAGGRAARDIIEGAGGLGGIVYDPVAGLQNTIFGTSVPRLQDQTRQLADYLGLPQPETQAERVASAVGQSVVGGGGLIGAGRTVAARASGPVTRAVAANVAAQPALQGISSATGGAAAQTAREEGYGPLAQLGAGLLGGLAGAVVPGAAGAGAAAAARLRQGATTQAAPIAATPARQSVNVSPSRVKIGQAAIPAPEAAGVRPITDLRTMVDLAQAATSPVKALTRPVIDDLAMQAMPDPAKIAAAERIGVAELLSPGQYSANPAFRELTAAVKSFPGSAAKAKDIENLGRVAEVADSLLTSLGAPERGDLSQVSRTVLNRLNLSEKTMQAKASALYEDVATKVGNPLVGADNMLAYLQQKAAALGGDDALQSIEKKALELLSNPEKRTYARLDAVRKELTNARVNQASPYYTADKKLISDLEGALMADQKAAVQAFGGDDALQAFELAQKTYAARKAVQEDIVNLFGDDLAGNIVSDIRAAAQGASKGDYSRISRLMQAIPEESRQEVALSAVRSAFAKNAQANDLAFADFSKWYKGIKNNRVAYSSLFRHVSPQARKTIDDLATVADGIAKEGAQYIGNGRLMVAKELMDEADQAVGKVASKVSAAASLASPVMPYGQGFARVFAAASQGGKGKTQRAISELLASPEFQQSVQSIASGNSRRIQEAQARLAKSAAWSKYSALLPSADQARITAIGPVLWMKEREQEQPQEQTEAMQ